MLLKKSVLLAILVCLLSISAVYCQEKKIIQGPPLSFPELSPQTDIEWLWGEVVLVNTANNDIIVKYLDYETDLEKEMAVSVDEKTTYENVGSLNEINAGENVSIDYFLAPEGRKIAKNISLEKAQDSVTQQDIPSANSDPQAVSVNELTVTDAPVN